MNDVGLILARNLIRFRRDKNQTQEELATIAGIPPDCLRELELATDAPRSMEVITKLAFALNQTVFDLYRVPKTMRSVRFRANRSFDEDARVKVVDDCVRRLDDYCFLENLLQEQSAFNLQAPRRDGKRVDPIQYASEARRRLGLSSYEPIFNVADVLNSSGAKFWFYKRDPSDKVFGLAFNETPQRTGLVVFEDASISTERLIFSAFHELGHLALHSRTFDASKEQEDKEEEREANQFASAFLMPNEEFKRRWDDTTGLCFVDRVLSVKRFFRVSYMTVLFRLVDLGKETKGVYAKFRNLYKRTGRAPFTGTQEPCGLERLDISDDRFRRLVYVALEHNEITRSRAAELLGVSAFEICDVLRKETTFE